MITRITPSAELKQLFIEMMINQTTKVSKISKGSTLDGVSHGVAKTGEKALKDVALVESHLFPSFAFGTHLDDVAGELGIAPRYGTSGSSTYLLVAADAGTIYTKAANTFTGSHGIVFEMEELSITIPAEGFTYIKVRSTSLGSEANVDPSSISEVANEPVGHQYTINEYQAAGGRDAEDDTVFRMRIKDGANLAAMGTLATIEQAFMKTNNNILRVFYYGISDLGKARLAIVTQNGIDLSVSELDLLLSEGEQYLSLADIRPYGATIYGVELVNITWFEVDVDFRVKIGASYDVDEVRKKIQIKMGKYLDYRLWKSSDRVEWDDLLELVKNTAGVEYVPDNHFVPFTDLTVPSDMLPRMRGFKMRDLDGNIIVDINGNLDPTYFPNEQNTSFQSTILSEIVWQ